MPIPIYVKIALWTAYLLSLYFAIFWFLVLLDREKKTKARRLRKFPTVTILVPAYNEEKNIESTLNSLAELDYPKKKLEVIVVNDGSTDNTRHVVKNFSESHKDCNIRLISKKNAGKGAALNDGLKAAQGEYFVCMDADSRATKDALKILLRHFTDEKIAAVLPLMKVDRPKNLWQKMQWLEYLVNMFYKRLMSRLNCVHVAPGPFSVYRTGILRKIGGFDEDNLTEDLEISLRLQSRDYRIVQLLEAEVFTLAPKTFKELYKQRTRWYKGSVINALRYRHMFFNRKYGDFGFIQMPTIIISGFIAVILFSSLAYYGLKPYVKGIYNSFLIDFDFYTLIKTFQYDFNILDINYTTILVAVIMLAISIIILKKSHTETKERLKKHGLISLASYLFFYFLVMGFIWVGITLNFLFRREHKW